MDFNLGVQRKLDGFEVAVRHALFLLPLTRLQPIFTWRGNHAYRDSAKTKGAEREREKTAP